jgi:hypothetical protein
MDMRKKYGGQSLLGEDEGGVCERDEGGVCEAN